MHVMVLGAGIIGVTTAWYLRQAGHQVTVVDRNAGPAREASYANGGQISVSHAEPWANPSTPWKVLRGLTRDDAPLRLRPQLDPEQWRWVLRFLRECTPGRRDHNLIRLIGLGLYSRSSLQDLRRELKLDYDQRSRGILHFYTCESELRRAMEPARIMREAGCDRRIVAADEVVGIEPALKPIERNLAGGTFTPEDESGDAFLFSERLAERADQAGVDFRYDTEVRALEPIGRRIAGVRVVERGRPARWQADRYVLCLGSDSRFLAAPLGLRLHVYPIKGYSVTVPVKNADAALEVSLIDDEYKLVYSRLGDRIRVAGTAELGGHDRTPAPARCRAILRRAAAVMPDAGDWEAAEPWAGLRPSTPSSLPRIGRSALDNLYLNTGHGTLGWTLACGSARALVDILDGRTPEPDFDFMGLPRTSKPIQASNPIQSSNPTQRRTRR